MTGNDTNGLFFDNALDASSKILELEQFMEYVGGFLSNEAKYFDEEAHPDMTHEFLPLFAETLPPILDASVIISACTLLEQEMRGFATALLAALGSELKLGDFSGSIVERFRVVAMKLAKLPLDDSPTPWHDVVGVFEIRNCLIHSGGDLSAFQKASTIRAFSTRHTTPVCTDGRIRVNRNTSTTVVRIASDFLHDTYNLALKRFPGQHEPLRRYNCI